ncbi:MAG: sodium:solute symporter family protein [bacterium]|nr:sodium:solute symporter family protein [bacterium]
MTLAIVLLYLATVFSIGILSHRLFRGTGVDFFLASRTIGPFLLLMSLFGTHMTAFSLLGASGEAYHRGVGVFALMASSSALVVPLAFLFLAPRVWRLGERHGYLTQVEFFRDRWQSDGLGLLLFAVMVVLLVPYLLIGIKGGGITLAQITGGATPEWVGSVLMSVVVLGYVSIGGLRGTAWANTFQTLVFMTLGAVTFFLITHKLGGLGSAMERLDKTSPDLLARGQHIAPLELLTYTAIPLSVAMFPHIFMHWLTARSERAFRLPIVAYPICVAIVWIPSVVLGLLGNLDFPGLVGPEANAVLVKMIGEYAPGAMAGMLAAGVFAAVMSSLDSQVLSLSTMFTRDIVRHYGFHDHLGDRRSILVGRIFVLGIFAVALTLSLTVDRSLFKLGVWSFTGFAALTPVIVAALYWKRSTRTGAFAAVLVTAGLWICFFAQAGWPGYTVLGIGIMPVAVILAASATAMVVGSLLSEAPPEEHLARFFE